MSEASELSSISEDQRSPPVHPSISVGNAGLLSLILLYMCVHHSNVVVACLMFCNDLSSSIFLKTLCKTSEDPVNKRLLWSTVWCVNDCKLFIYM
jgi:hypothetical protein